MQTDVFPDDPDPHFPPAAVDARNHFLPIGHIRLFRIDLQLPADNGGKIFLFQHQRGFIERRDRNVVDDAIFPDVAEICDFIFDVPRHARVDARNDDIRMNPQALHFLYGMLRRFRFEFAGSRDIGDERDVHIKAVFPPDFPSHLTDRLQKGLALDIADRPADFRYHHVGVGFLSDIVNKRLDFVRHMRNHLYGLTQIIAAPLFI